MNKKVKDTNEFITSDLKLIALAKKDHRKEDSEEVSERDEVGENKFPEITIS